MVCPLKPWMVLQYYLMVLENPLKKEQNSYHMVQYRSQPYLVLVCPRNQERLPWVVRKFFKKSRINTTWSNTEVNITSHLKFCVSLCLMFSDFRAFHSSKLLSFDTHKNHEQYLENRNHVLEMLRDCHMQVVSYFFHSPVYWHMPFKDTNTS